MDRLLKRFAKSNNLKIQHKTATGSLQGHTVTVSEGKEFVQLHIFTYFEDVNKQQDFEASLNRKLISREHRVLEMKFMPNSILVTLSYRFSEDITRIEGFANYFFPLLSQSGAIRTGNTLESPTTDNSAKKRFAFF